VVVVRLIPLRVAEVGGSKVTAIGMDPGHRSISVGVYHRPPEVSYVNERRGRAVKKLLLVALAAIGGLLVYRQIQADRAEQDLWTEATDSVPAGSGV
jgi:hypothetical protein